MPLAMVIFLELKFLHTVMEKQFISHIQMDFTTVYGHLQKGNGAIEEYIKRHIMRKNHFEIELFKAQ